MAIIVQPAGGRLDILLQDEDSHTRYEVEIQLGPTDPSHIIRTIEYWDSERRRFPKWNHIAVIVAENITGRFNNVIQLFNRNIPIIALQMSAYKNGSDISLAFTSSYACFISSRRSFAMSYSTSSFRKFKKSPSPIVPIAGIDYVFLQDMRFLFNK